MPTIIGPSTNVAEVTPSKAIRVALWERGEESYSVKATTGVLGVALAADAPVFGLRHALGAGKRVYIDRIDIAFGVVAVFTATAQQFGFYLERFSAAALAGGATNTPMRHDQSGGGSEISEARVATTAALTVAGVTFEGNKVPILGWAGLNAVGFNIGPFTAFDGTESSPIELAAGEGLSIRNLIVWPAAGTGVVTARVAWHER